MRSEWPLFQSFQLDLSELANMCMSSGFLHVSLVAANVKFTMNDAWMLVVDALSNH